MTSSTLVLNKAVNATYFVYCIVYQGPQQAVTYYNTGNGHFHQYVYILEGDGTALGEVRLTADQSEVPEIVRTNDIAGELIDVDETTRGKYVSTVTKDTGVSLIMFNPVPDTRRLKVEIVDGDTTKTVTATDNRITIVSIIGPVLANGIEINSLDFANILPGKSAELYVPKNSICALVTE